MKRAIALVALAVVVLAQSAGIAKPTGTPELVAVSFNLLLAVDRNGVLYTNVDVPTNGGLSQWRVAGQLPPGEPVSLLDDPHEGQAWVIGMRNGDVYQVSLTPGNPVTFHAGIAGNVFSTPVAAKSATWSQMKAKAR